MIGGNYTETTRDNWVTVPGRSEELTRDNSGNITKITFLEGEDIVFAQYFMYDANGNVTKIECKTN